MLLAVDIGNTNIVAALFEGDKIISNLRVATYNQNLAEEFRQYIQNENIQPENVETILVANVVPDIREKISDVIISIFHHEAIFIQDIKSALPINITLPNINEIGDDRLVDAIAGYDITKEATIIIDCGTATTFDVVNRSGDYLGGIIAPGINLSIEALANRTAQLPKIAFTKPNAIIGNSTKTAMQSGLFYGYISLIEGLLNKIQSSSKENYRTIITGGHSKLLFDNSDLIEICDTDLTVKGLKIINEYLKQK